MGEGKGEGREKRRKGGREERKQEKGRRMKGTDEG